MRALSRACSATASLRPWRTPWHRCFTPVVEDGETLFVGGNFWDGRATGERLGDPIAEQAQGPFVNPVEQALPDTGCVVRRVCSADYAAAFEARYPGSCSIAWPSDVDAACAVLTGILRMAPRDRAKSDQAYDHIATAVAAYERSREVNPFSSKFDRYLAGEAVADDRRKRRGLDLFVGRGKCANCHPIDRGPNGEPPLLTDFTFDNLGVPRNPENPWYQGRRAQPCWRRVGRQRPGRVPRHAAGMARARGREPGQAQGPDVAERGLPPDRTRSSRPTCTTATSRR